MIKEEDKSCVYWITYSGDKHPSNYIGSVYQKKIDEGYLGSTSSKKWAGIVKQEQKEHPELYNVKIIYECDNRKDAGIMEGIIQKLYNVVTSDEFWNMAIATNGHIYTCRKGIEPWNKKGSTGNYSKESLVKMRNSKIGISIHTNEFKQYLSEINKGELNAFYGKQHSKEQKEKWAINRKGTQVGCKNHNANIIYIYDNINNLKYTCDGNFFKLCKENNLPLNALMNSYKNGGNPIYQTAKSFSRTTYKNYKGWSAVKLNKQKEVMHV